MIERFDFFFSYWIFFWYILYELNLVNYSPKIAFILSILINILELIAMIYFFSSLFRISLFIVSVILFKILPLYTLRNDILKYKDFICTIAVFLIYFTWLYINQISLMEISKEVYKKIKNNEDVGPAMNFIDKYINKI